MTRKQRNERLMQAIGRRLRELREERGLSMERVSFTNGTYLPRIELGGRNITLSTLIKLCRFYGITVTDFFRGLDYDQAGTRR